MTPRVAIKTFLDAAMLILYLQLTFMYDHNPLYHEVAGISLGVLFAIHVVLNIREANALVNRRKLLPLILDVALLASVVVSVVTGLTVAKELYEGPGNGEIVLVHNIAAYVGLGAIAIHLLMHAKYLAVVLGAGKMPATEQPAALSEGKAAQITRRQFVKRAALAGAGTFVVASFLVLEIPVIGKLFAEEDEDVASSPVLRMANEERRRSVSDRSKGEDIDDATPKTDESSVSSSDDDDIHCTICRRNCPLSDLHCKRGVEWATENGYL